MSWHQCAAVNPATGTQCTLGEGHRFPNVHETPGELWTPRDPAAPDAWCPVCHASPGSRCVVRVPGTVRLTGGLPIKKMVDYPHRGRVHK